MQGLVESSRDSYSLLLAKGEATQEICQGVVGEEGFCISIDVRLDIYKNLNDVHINTLFMHAY